MLSKKVLKDIQSLSLKKNRSESGLFVAEGPKVVAELLQNVPDSVEAVYATEAFGISHEKIQIISAEDLQRISFLKTPNEVLALVRQFSSEPPPGNAFILYLDTVQDPGNFGTIVRTADWFGIEHIVCSTGCADLYNPKVVQSTMASISRVNVFYDKGDNWLQVQKGPVYAGVLEGTNLYDLEKTSHGILLIGNESKGIRPQFLSRATTPVTIPRRGGAESLNAAVATGVLLSHLLR